MDGFTCQANVWPVVVISELSVSVNRIGSRITVPKSSCHTGEVEVWKDFEMRSVEPAGAEPSITEWSAVSAVASSIV